ncbi:SMI1/KNR4 family protein [Streptomyces sp. NPDC091387]|uniref:SMI1/KNR4 family protein n=1 Tax=Streptomyces sp. NPDC091387 TaxID=3365998 RepID=UPI0037F5ACE9
MEQPRVPAAISTCSGLSDGDLNHLESTYLEYRLPESYRTFMIENGGGAPVHPVVHPRHGFVLDQQFFNLYGDPDPYDLLDNMVLMADRLTGDHLAIAWVQGGAPVLRIQGAGSGSILYWDNDDRRTRQGDTPEISVSRLEHLADDIVTLLEDELVQVPAELEKVSRSAVSGGFFRPVTPDNAGAGLPAGLRA